MPKAIPSKRENEDICPKPPHTKSVMPETKLNVATATALNARDGFLLEKIFITVLLSVQTSAEKNKSKYVDEFSISSIPFKIYDNPSRIFSLHLKVFFYIL